MVMPNDNPREEDCFRPPDVPIEVKCIHCGQVYNSSKIEWRPGAGPPGYAGAWCCPIAGCDGLGFLFDIWPTDPEWTDEHGNKVVHFFDDEEFEVEDGTRDDSTDQPKKLPRENEGFFNEDDVPF